MISFEKSLSGIIESSFFSCGQPCTFVRRLATRYLISTSLPVETDWLGSNLRTAIKFSSQQFLDKLRNNTEVATACKRKTESDISERKGNKGAIEKLSTKLQEQFAFSA